MPTSRPGPFVLGALAILLGIGLGAVPGHAGCDPTTDPDRTDVANARAAIAANCICADSVRHGAYVSCAVQEANATLVNKSCAGLVKRCASRSTCGKPGFVTCCVTKPNGTKCKIKRDAARCTAKAGTCVGGYTSCCDACTSTGCAATMTTSTTTTTVPAGCIPTGTGVPCDIATSVCCAVPHASAVCTGNPSTCHLNLCDPGFGNCNDTAADGCEVDFGTDASNCGGCGHVCPSGQSCSMGSCG